MIAIVVPPGSLPLRDTVVGRLVIIAIFGRKC